MYNSWLEKGEHKALVREFWNKETQCTTTYRLAQKIQQIKVATKAWVKMQSPIAIQIGRIVDKLNATTNNLEEDSSNQALMDNREKEKLTLLGLIEQEESILKQQIK